MFTQKEINIFDFDIYARRISFFFNSKEKIGSVFGFILTILYVISTLFLILFYSIRTIKRKDFSIHDSIMLSQDVPSINISPNTLYFAFGLELPNTLNRYIDETIYYPEIYFISKEKGEDGILETKEKININVERCNVKKFGENYEKLFSKDELNNSYCLGDYNLTLSGGFQYDKLSYIRIKIFPCVNTSENNYHCKPKNVIDSYLSSTYFSMIIKDIGLNPLNYEIPVIPIIQNVFDTFDKSIYKDFYIYFGITEIHTDTGLLTSKIKRDMYLQFRKYYSSFYLKDENEYNKRNEILVAQIRLEENIKIQKRTYTKFPEIFSIIGGYMQLISNIFMLITILMKNVNIEKKLLNYLFNFNIKQRKIILSVKYARKLNYTIYYDKGESTSCIPFHAYKSLTPYKNKPINIRPTSNKNLLKFSKNNSFAPLIKKSATGTFRFKSYDIKKQTKNNSVNENIKIANQIIKKNKDKESSQEQNMNKSKMLLFKEDDSNESQINRIFLKGSKNKYYKYNSKEEEVEEKSNGNESISNVNINLIDYFCRFGKKANQKVDVKLFQLGVYFYRNQLSVINFFNITFLFEIMLTRQPYKRLNILNKTIDIPIKSYQKDIL